jgi:hypothetical protein
MKDITIMTDDELAAELTMLDSIQVAPSPIPKAPKPLRETKAKKSRASWKDALGIE